MGRGHTGAWTFVKLNHVNWKKYVTAPMHLQRGVMWLCVYVCWLRGWRKSENPPDWTTVSEPSRDQISTKPGSKNHIREDKLFNSYVTKPPTTLYFVIIRTNLFTLHMNKVARGSRYQWNNLHILTWISSSCFFISLIVEPTNENFSIDSPSISLRTFSHASKEESNASTDSPSILTRENVISE